METSSKLQSKNKIPQNLYFEREKIRDFFLVYTLNRLGLLSVCVIIKNGN